MDRDLPDEADLGTPSEAGADEAPEQAEAADEAPDQAEAGADEARDQAETGAEDATDRAEASADEALQRSAESPETAKPKPDPVVGVGVFLVGLLIMATGGATTHHYVFNVGEGILLLGAVVFLLSVAITSLRMRPIDWRQLVHELLGTESSGAKDSSGGS